MPALPNALAALAARWVPIISVRRTLIDGVPRIKCPRIFYVRWRNRRCGAVSSSSLICAMPSWRWNLSAGWPLDHPKMRMADDMSLVRSEPC